MKQNDSDVLKVSGINSKGYGMFPKMVSKDRRLTIEAVGIYAYICSYAGSGNTAFPSVSTILYDLGIGENRYYNHLKLLVKYGYISVEKIRGEKGKFNHNIYVLNAEILDSNEEKEPYPQNRGTVKNEQNQPYPQNRGMDDQGMDNGGTNTNSSKINNLEEEEQTEKFPKKYIELALKVGANKLDLVAALKKMDSEPDIKSPIAWLQKALENEVINKELASRPKTKRDPKPSTKLHSTRTAKQPKTDSDKYEKFYL